MRECTYSPDPGPWYAPYYGHNDGEIEYLEESATALARSIDRVRQMLRAERKAWIEADMPASEIDEALCHFEATIHDTIDTQRRVLLGKRSDLDIGDPPAECAPSEPELA